MRQLTGLIVVCSALSATEAAAITDRQLSAAFYRTALGAEFGDGAEIRSIKKFVQPIRFFIDDRSGVPGMREAVSRFVLTLPQMIPNLDVSIVPSSRNANFQVFMVPERDYPRVVNQEIYRRASSIPVPGKCMVRVVAAEDGIVRSDAVIVTDKGRSLFRRCLIEEIFQGLGPAQDDPSLRGSVFNDRSKLARVTWLDRVILNILYHPTLRPGMTQGTIQKLLPRIITEVRRNLR